VTAVPIHLASGGRSYIPSSAARLLEQELRSYRDQKIRGRSFLIAGHRGAGKTSLVSNALREVQDEALV
jgi:Cdc6-like AAA superfamily ATPase